MPVLKKERESQKRTETIRILVTDKISDQGLEVFGAHPEFQVDVKTGLSPEELKTIVQDYDGWVVRSGTKVTADLIEAAKKLRIIGRAGVGVDNVDLAAATKRGVVVMNAPDGNTISTAEHTLAMLMAVARWIPQAHQSMKEKKWERSRFVGCELRNKVLGVVGMGRIGTQVAKMALGIGMQVLAYDPFLDPEKSQAHEFSFVSFDELLRKSDFITVHTPLTQETRGMIAAEQIGKMKKGVYLINCARGGIIREADLVEALQSGKVAGAALDVFEKEPPFESPLLDLENVVVVPHLGASTREAQENVAVVVAEQMVEAFLNGRVRNAVNMPSLDPKILEEWKPYVELMERMGAFHAQLAESYVKQVEIEFIGEVTRHDVRPLSLSFLKGLLQGGGFSETVNYVNAMVLAKERGIRVTETVNEQPADYASLIRVRVVNEKGEHRTAGTVFGRMDLRIVFLDGNTTDFPPTGRMIWMMHKDKPGIVGRLGSILGENNINIAGLYVGRREIGGRAVAMVNVDQDVAPDVLKALQQISGIEQVKFVRFDS